MSQFGDSSAESDHEEHIRKRSFESADSVEYVNVPNCWGRFQSFFIRLVISCIVIGACAGAIVWSIEENETGTDINPHDASKNFTIFIDQYTKKAGTFTVTYRKANGEENTGPGEHEIHPTVWYQSHKNKTLVHKLNSNTTIYAMSAHSFWYTDDGHNPPHCRHDTRTNYFSYINNLGMTSLTREHSEIETTKHHTKVFIYQGDPNEVAIIGTPQRAFLVTAYADAESGALLGWDTYFASSTSADTVYEMSYWYDDMVPSEPHEHDMIPPKECEP